MSQLCMNIKNRAVTSFSGFDFVSAAQAEGIVLLANGDGLFVAGGDNDNGDPISATVTLGISNFGSVQRKVMPDAYLVLRGAGAVKLRVGADGIDRLYTAKSAPKDLDNVRFKLARGVKANYWQVGIENIDGADFELSGLELAITPIGRR